MGSRVYGSGLRTWSILFGAFGLKQKGFEVWVQSIGFGLGLQFRDSGSRFRVPIGILLSDLSLYSSLSLTKLARNKLLSTFDWTMKGEGLGRPS